MSEVNWLKLLGSKMFFKVAFILQREYEIAFDNNFCQETLVFLVLLENFHKQKIYESNPNLVTWIFQSVNMTATGISQKQERSPHSFSRYCDKSCARGTQKIMPLASLATRNGELARGLSFT